MKRIETLSDFQKTFIDILDGAFEFCLLFCSEVRCQESVRRVVLGNEGYLVWS